jgi:hypothetical protein
MKFIYEYAREIENDWDKVNYAARPYLDAMHTLSTIDQMYYFDTARSVVGYFLANAGTWRGETARRVKKELREMIND